MTKGRQAARRRARRDRIIGINIGRNFPVGLMFMVKTAGWIVYGKKYEADMIKLALWVLF
jgi:hypothetical protein